MNIVFRCDASTLIGTGHIHRCLNLALRLRDNGANVFFVSRAHSGNLIELIKKYFSVFVLPDLPKISHASNLLSEYSSWLGCDESSDAEQFVDVLSSHEINDIDWIIVDHYSLSSVWRERIDAYASTKFAKVKYAYIDDLINRKINCHLYVNAAYPYSSSTMLPQDSLVCTTQSCLGPKFALLSEDYLRSSANCPTRNSLKRVLIFFGGVDANNFTEKIISKIMANTDYCDSLSFDIVLGSNYSHHNSLNELINNKACFHLYDSLPSLLPLMCRADLSIGACGMTAWERISMSLPSIIFPIASNPGLYRS